MYIKKIGKARLDHLIRDGMPVVLTSNKLFDHVIEKTQQKE